MYSIAFQTLPWRTSPMDHQPCEIECNIDNTWRTAWSPASIHDPGIGVLIRDGEWRSSASESSIMAVKGTISLAVGTNLFTNWVIRIIGVN